MSSLEHTPVVQEEATSQTRRERKRLARRNNMLEHAMEIIVEGGLKALTIAKLAKRLDAAVGALYRYFPSKQALLVALEHRALENFSAVLSKDLEAAQSYLNSQPSQCQRAAALMRLLVAAYAYIYDGVRAPTRHRLMDILVTTPEQVLEDHEALEVEASLQKLLSQVAQLLTDAVSLGALREEAFTSQDSYQELFSPENSDSLHPSESSPKHSLQSSSLPTLAWQRTYVLWSHLHGLNHFQKRDRFLPEALRVSVLFRRGVRDLLQGWGATPDDLQAAFDLFETFLPFWTQEPQQPEPE